MLAFPELGDDHDSGGDDDGGEDTDDIDDDTEGADAGDEEELDEDDLDQDGVDHPSGQRVESHQAVPDFFFSRMVANDDGDFKVRIVLEARWEDDGTVDGTVTENRIVVSTMAEEYGEQDYAPLPASERSRIQMIYIPASRDGARQVNAFLRGRLWRAAQWSADLRDMVGEHAGKVAEQFDEEPVVDAVEGALGQRWQELHDAGTTQRRSSGSLTATSISWSVTQSWSSSPTRPGRRDRPGCSATGRDPCCISP